MVVAQFTGVSLQNDYTSWEQFTAVAAGALFPTSRLTKTLIPMTSG